MSHFFEHCVAFSMFSSYHHLSSPDSMNTVYPINGLILRSCINTHKHQSRQPASNMQCFHHMCRWVPSPVPHSEPFPLTCPEGPNGWVSDRPHAAGFFSGRVITRVARGVCICIPQFQACPCQEYSFYAQSRVTSDRISHGKNSVGQV